MTSWWKLIAQRAGHADASSGSWKRRYVAGEGNADEVGNIWPERQVAHEGATRDQGSWTKRLVDLGSTVAGAAARSLYNQEGGVDEDTGIEFEGFEDPPVVEVDVINDEIVISGKVKPGYYGKFVYPVEAFVAGTEYRVNFEADLSAMSAGGTLAAFGFGAKQGNRANLTLLQGLGAGQVRGAIVRMSPPNGWNKPTGHTVTDLGAPTSGDQHEGDIKLAVSPSGTTFNFYTSGDGQDTWDEETVAASFSPFSSAAAAEEVGFAGYFHSSDTGEFTVTIRWESSGGDTTPPTLTNPTGGDAP